MHAAHEKIHPAGRLGRAGYIQGYRTSYGIDKQGKKNKYKD